MLRAEPCCLDRAPAKRRGGFDDPNRQRFPLNGFFKLHQRVFVRPRYIRRVSPGSRQSPLSPALPLNLLARAITYSVPPSTGLLVIVSHNLPYHRFPHAVFASACVQASAVRDCAPRAARSSCAR